MNALVTFQMEDKYYQQNTRTIRESELLKEPDVAILAAPTHAATGMLRNTALGCLAKGLSVAILVPVIGSWYKGVAELYSDLPARIIPVRLKGPYSPGWGYPRPIAWLTLLPRFLKTLDNLSPRCVLTHIDSQDAWRVIHYWAQSRHVPGIVLQEGISAPLKVNCTELQLDQEVYLSFKSRLQIHLLRMMAYQLFRFAECYHYAAHVCVWGPAMRRELVTHGRTEGDITVTGSPRFDHICKRRPIAPSEMATVLFAHQHQQDRYRELDFCRLVIDTCVNRIACKLVFRPHPRSGIKKEEISRLLNQISNHSNLVTVAEDGDVTDYLQMVSVFLTLHSSSAYDAIIQGIPLVLADWVDPHYRLNAADYGAAIQVNHPADLERALRDALWDEETRNSLYHGGERLITDHLYRLDGRASNRVADTVLQLISRFMARTAINKQ